MVWGDEPAKDVIGKTVTGTIDRPIGSRHPLYPDTVYPVSYGFEWIATSRVLKRCP